MPELLNNWTKDKYLSYFLSNGIQIDEK